MCKLQEILKFNKICSDTQASNSTSGDGLIIQAEIRTHPSLLPANTPNPAQLCSFRGTATLQTFILKLYSSLETLLRGIAMWCCNGNITQANHWFGHENVDSRTSCMGTGAALKSPEQREQEKKKGSFMKKQTGCPWRRLQGETWICTQLLRMFQRQLLLRVSFWKS